MIKKKSSGWALAITLAIPAGLVYQVPAVAQSVMLEEVVVTAQKREQN